jgi:UDP-N-acetylmuramate: L-alanyl-gamma-D-glutamyl-meso-diaminopimelate ligase
MKKEQIHFIAIGGAAMHNLAIALHKKGYQITGSDDEIFNPSKSRLEKFNLLPKAFGWFPENIDQSLDAIILGMHAKKDNPELIRAQELGIPIYSYPEYLYKQTQHKKRIAIAGSHGKTTTTSMIMHVLKTANISFDYMVGANLDGFETMVNLQEDNDVAVFEADEYLSSPIDMRSKFLWYKPHISVITGIAWDHINVFPTFDSYLDTFRAFLDTIPPEGKLFYFELDMHLIEILKANNYKFSQVPYNGFIPDSNQKVKVNDKTEPFSPSVFGSHNLQNMQSAYLVAKELDISDQVFIEAMKTFTGAARRLQIIRENPNPIYFDFAHAPSKVKATVNALREKHPEKKILACLELHTFSSLNKSFIPQYNQTLANANEAIVYFNPKTLEHKKMPPLSIDFVSKSFNHNNLHVANDSEAVLDKIRKCYSDHYIVLIMTSGNFNGVNFSQWSKESLQ